MSQADKYLAVRSHTIRSGPDRANITILLVTILQTENMLDMMTLTTGLTNQRLQKSQQWPGIFMSQ
jgi:hypothetical protein